MYSVGHEKFVPNCQIDFNYSLQVLQIDFCGYRVIILSVHISGIARTAVSFSGDILNNSESNRTYFSDKVSNFLIMDFELGSLICDKYRYRSLKYGLYKYPACISLISIGK